MANNRMYLLHRPTGKAVYLGKRMGYGWYGTPENVAERIEALFSIVEDGEYEGSQDDFCIALENAKDATLATDAWIGELPGAPICTLKPPLREVSPSPQS